MHATFHKVMIKPTRTVPVPPENIREESSTPNLNRQSNIKLPKEEEFATKDWFRNHFIW